MNINTSKEKSEYPEFNALKFIPWTKIMNYVDFWETYKNLVNNKSWYFNNSLSEDKANYIFLEIGNNQKIILWKLYNWSIVFNEWVSEMILSMLDSCDFTEIEDAIKLLLENDYSIHSEISKYDEKVKNISINCFNKSIRDLLNINDRSRYIEKNKFASEYPNLIMLCKYSNNIISYQNDWDFIQIWVIMWEKILLFNDINKERLLYLEADADKNPKKEEVLLNYIKNFIKWEDKSNFWNKTNSITKIEEWHDCFLIDEFNEKYPWLYALHSLNKNDETIIQYNKWWEVINIWFYSWDNILLFDWIDEKKLDNLEMHAFKRTALINKKIEKIIGPIWKK